LPPFHYGTFIKVDGTEIGDDIYPSDELKDPFGTIWVCVSSIDGVRFLVTKKKSEFIEVKEGEPYLFTHEGGPFRNKAGS